MHMVPAIRNILGGFLFSGDDVYKQVRVLSGGERTRLAVARMLLRPSNTLLLDEPTNHLDLDSKEVLLDALVDYGGTLIFVSHDRYFVERLATKIIEVGHGTRARLSGHLRRVPLAQGASGRAGGRTAGSARRRTDAPRRSTRSRAAQAASRRRPRRQARRSPGRRPPAAPHVARRAETRRRRGAKRDRAPSRRRRAQIDGSKRGSPRPKRAIRELEQTMAAPGFYEDRAAAQPVIDRHQALMWQVGDLMHQWEELQSAADLASRRPITRIVNRLQFCYNR